jgi:uncharacterized protein YgbK (DUF1537 family)
MRRLRVAFYGDDFTGSADAMEVLQWSGIRTILFLEPPTSDLLARFQHYEALGIAGRTRSMSPNEMELHLRPALAAMRDWGCDLVHYKVCSTFDSSPEVGSIGKAIEIGREVVDGGTTPMVVGAPNLGRYQVFGNLFARSGLDTEPFRLDRHPTMTHHPITPMNEADLRLHLARQTSLRVGLYDILRFDRRNAYGPDDGPFDCDVLLFDVLYPEHLASIGQRLVDLARQRRPIYVVGSSGVEYALMEHWKQDGGLPVGDSTDSRYRLASVEQLVAITGSCSPVNQRQVEWAQKHGYELIALDPARLLEGRTSDQETDRSIQQAVQCLARGASVILHSSLGPHDPRIALAIHAMRDQGVAEPEVRLKSGQWLGVKLGRILKGILDRRPVQRVGVAGGDTSGFIARELGIQALEALAPLAPGSPLCQAHARDGIMRQEFFFKGGQVGKDDVWGVALRGTPGPIR